ncbi:MAG: ABC transporter ATP-binding protein [Alphaproteobacteria bacterium]|nr:ABC transporter ATP-binding protein [Alphaproteobacteria bacterium]
MALLDIQDLSVSFETRFGKQMAVDGYGLSLERGEIHGLVGESGAGKSTVGAAILGLLPGGGQIEGGSIRLDGRELVDLSQRDWHRLRGAKISMIFQDPQTSLNPLLTIEEQLVETILTHTKLSEAKAKTRALSLLEEVGIRDAAARIADYPHQFSGGMRQRVVIALALCSEPDLIIADEPTTALDVAVQKQVLALIRRLATKRGVGVLLITHDMGVIAEITDTVSVLRDGRLVEAGETNRVLGAPSAPYSRSLIASVPRVEKKVARFPQLSDAGPRRGARSDLAQRGAEWLLSRPGAGSKREGDILDLQGLSVSFRSGGGLFRQSRVVRAVKDVGLRLAVGETLGLVGESGSGKSTIAKALVGVHKAQAGALRYFGRPLALTEKRPARDPSRREIQMIFQDPYSSLNNRWKVGAIVSEPLRFHGLCKNRREAAAITTSMLALVGMDPDAVGKYPHQFSGGQRQRIAIARALAARPALMICDEPTSALDVSVQAQILNLLKDIQDRFGLAILFISHDLPVVRQMSDRVAVMQNGVLVEEGAADAFYKSPRHDYSRMLLAQTPSLDKLADPQILAAQTVA